MKSVFDFGFSALSTNPASNNFVETVFKAGMNITLKTFEFSTSQIKEVKTKKLHF